MKYRFALTTLLILVVATAAMPTNASAAQKRPNAYISGFLGFNQTEDATVNNTDYAPPPIEYSDRLEFDPGIYIGGTCGFDFGLLRLEGELSYRGAEISSIHEIVPIAPPAQRFTSIDGDIDVLAMMANAWFDLENQSPVTPYWGGGIGVANLQLSDTSGYPANGGSRVGLYQEDDESVFAYQAGAGLELAINPRFSLDLGYRYFRTNEAKFHSPNPDIERRIEIESHNVALGFRAKF